MDEIPLKVMIIDPNILTADSLAKALREIDVILRVKHLATLEHATDALHNHDVNAIYIDPIDLGIDKASEFIFHIRRTIPAIVFVLYYEFEKERIDENHFYYKERGRFHHYFKLDKATPESIFLHRVKETVFACQQDLSAILTQEKIASLQKELTVIQKGASDNNVVVPLNILKEIQDQLAAWKKEAKVADFRYKPAQFLGPISSSVKADQCFIVIPYSESWSKGVEAILKESCEAAGFEFTIAKTMEGRFVPHDIWHGITGSGVIIADLTGANANVTYEVGLSDAIGCDVILICQGTKVPFDFLGQRLILYENTVEGAVVLRNKLTDRLKQIKVQLSEKDKRQKDN